MTAIADSDNELQQTLARLVDARSFPKTVCPSEVARALSATSLADLGAASWREAMPAVREAILKQTQLGELEILQKGEVRNVGSLDELRVPIRVRKCHRP